MMKCCFKHSRCIFFYAGIIMGVTLGCLLTLALMENNNSTKYYYYYKDNGAIAELVRERHHEDDKKVSNSVYLYISAEI